MTAEHPRTLIHTCRIPIRWGDMDAMGHVNNTVYFRYMEQARIEWLESVGYGVGVLLDEAPVIVNANCTFIVPFTYPATVEIRTYAGKPGRSSLQTWCEFFKVGEPTLYAEGGAKIVWTTPSTAKSAPLPDAIRQLVE